MFFPMEYPITKNNMNYAVVIVGNISILATVYWIASARHWFVRPKRTRKDPFQVPSVNITTSSTTKALTSSNASHRQL